MKPLVVIIVAAAALVVALSMVLGRPKGLPALAGFFAVALGATALVRIVDAGELGWTGYLAFIMVPLLAALASAKILDQRAAAIRVGVGLAAALLAIPLAQFVSYFFAAEGL
jgi:hypothetical protein